MKLRLRHVGWLLLVATVAHFLFAPVPISPKAFEPALNPGYTGPFARNERLGAVERLPLPAGLFGPEDGALGPDGLLYLSMRDGSIVRGEPAIGAMEVWVSTDGAPLGLDFGSDGTLWVADAYRGLLSIDRAGAVRVRCAEVDGVPLDYADDVAVTRDGIVYFTDASTKFGARAHGGTYPASVLDAFEHGRYGRLLRFDSRDDQVRVLRTGLAFANGVALSADERHLYVVETGENRVLTLARTGPTAGRVDVLIDGLPGFPDNIETGRDGRLWVGLVVPRNALLDFSADKPWLRTMAFRLPPFIRPKPADYGHLLSLSEQGQVLQDLQHPSAYTHITGALETDAGLYLTSLTEPALGRMPP